MKGWAKERRAQRWDKTHEHVRAWLHEKQQACVRRMRVRERRRTQKKQGHKKGGALQKGNAQEIKRETAQEGEKEDTGGGAERWSEKTSMKM